MLDERRTLSPVPVITTLPPALPDELMRDLPGWQRERLRTMLAEEEHRSIDDLPKPTFEWDRKREPDLPAPLFYGIGYQIQQPGPGIATIPDTAA